MRLRRILMVSEPGTYGVFMVVRQLIRHLHRAHPEITVDLAYSSRRSWPETFALADEVRAHGGEAIDLRVGNSPEPRDARALIQLLRLVRRRSTQVVHAHSSKAGGLCRLLARLPGFPPVLYTPHAFFGLAGHGGIKEKFYNTLESILGRAGHVHVLATDERRFALETLRLPAHSLILINTGILADQFVPADAAAKSAARDRLGLPREGRLLVTTGRDSAQKNYAPLYAALNRFLPGQPACFFAHAGAGAGKRRDAMDASSRARCFCFEHLAEVRELLWAADGFILTSFYEGLSISMLEAYSCGLSLLLTEAPGFSLMRTFGRNVVWMPAPKCCADFEGEVLNALRTWSGRPAAPSREQHEIALRHFNTPIQSGKIVRLYDWLLTKA